MTQLNSIAQFISKMQDAVVDVTVNNSDIALKKPVSEIISEYTSVEKYLQSIQNSHPKDAAIICIYVKNGNAWKKVSSEVLLPVVPQPQPQSLPAPQPPSNVPMSGLGNPFPQAKDSIWRDKYDHLKELYDDQKDTLKDLRKRNEDLVEQVRKLQVQVDTADEKHKIDLLKTELTNKQSLNGIITDATKPETISAIKELVVALKMGGGAAAPAQSKPDVLDGISDAQMRTAIESNIKLLASLDKETVGKLIFINDALAAAENRETLDSVFNQILSQQQQ